MICVISRSRMYNITYVFYLSPSCELKGGYVYVLGSTVGIKTRVDDEKGWVESVSLTDHWSEEQPGWSAWNDACKEIKFFLCSWITFLGCVSSLAFYPKQCTFLSPSTILLIRMCIWNVGAWPATLNDEIKATCKWHKEPRVLLILKHVRAPSLRSSDCMWKTLFYPLLFWVPITWGECNSN